MRIVEQQVLDFIDGDGLIAAVQDLIAVPSVGGAETAAQEHIAALLELVGMRLDAWEIDVDAVTRHPACSYEVDRSTALGVVGSYGGSAGPRLVLNGHIDVVPVGDPGRWTHDPWRGTTVGDRLYGRGSADMKAGLLAGVFAVKAIADAGVELAGAVDVWSVIGEEDGGMGTLATLLRGHTGDAAIVMEPTEMTVAAAQAGALGFRVTVPGLAAHGCVRREGVSAVEKFTEVHAALLELEARRNERVCDPMFADYELPVALSIGCVNAGDWASTVPESLVFTGRYGVAVGETLDEAVAEFEAAVAHVVARDPWLSRNPPVVEWSGGRFAPVLSPPTDLIPTLRDALPAAGGPPGRVRGITYGSDLRLLVDEGGIPGVLFGPGDVRVAHQTDEYVPVSDVVTTARALALTALRFCGVAP
ncbi:MAG TPA: ArgE/DapE family deacylase [Mycobacteriales bacterium]|nr:ArgE/DapE family deacylase [Mycobacteriales bacterium]